MISVLFAAAETKREKDNAQNVPGNNSKEQNNVRKIRENKKAREKCA